MHNILTSLWQTVNALSLCARSQIYHTACKRIDYVSHCTTRGTANHGPNQKQCSTYGRFVPHQHYLNLSPWLSFCHVQAERVVQCNKTKASEASYCTLYTIQRVLFLCNRLTFYIRNSLYVHAHDAIFFYIILEKCFEVTYRARFIINKKCSEYMLHVCQICMHPSSKPKIKHKDLPQRMEKSMSVFRMDSGFYLCGYVRLVSIT